MKNSIKVTMCLTVCLWLFSIQALSAEKLVVIHPRLESALDKRYEYHWAVLAAALEATKKEGEYILKQADLPMSENRALEELRAASGKITILRDNCSKTMEKYLLPVKIPLLKGSLGWRVFLIRKEMQKELLKVTTLDELKKYSIGAGDGWGNVGLLEDAGFSVKLGYDYEGLFRMVMAGRFDLYDRGIMEAPIELAERQAIFPDMVIEKKFILRYPILDYFYVNKNDTALAARIERGLKAIIKNGTLDRLFDKYYWKSIESLHIDSRKIFDIGNPDLGQLPSPDRKEYWLEDFINKKKTGKL